MIKKKDLSEKDKETWETYIKNPSDVYDKDKNNQKNQDRKERFRFDLHGHTLDEANQTVENFINKSFENNISKLIIVTGKGLHSDNSNDPYVSKNLSILKYSVPEFISNNKNLMKIIYEMKDANTEDGGSGAFYIFLKKKKSKNLF